MKYSQHFTVLVLLLLLVMQPAVALAQQNPSDDHSGSAEFSQLIQPLLKQHCYQCHAGTTEEGGLNLGIRARVMEGGDSGPALVPGDSQTSLLFQLVSGAEEGRRMPPEGHSPLTQPEMELLKNWIDRGAAWPDNADVIDPKWDRALSHWAFQRLKLVPVPDANSDWPQGPIDRFILRSIEQAGLHPAQKADPGTLVRRLYFDLIGLPPTPQQVEQFLADYSQSPDKTISHLVDDLLASPRYGERWGRHWLDVARYADSDGQETDKDRPHAYVYRDFVIQAFNQNMPYDQFIRWQIAGDEFEPQNDDAVAATGFLTAGPAFKLPDSFIESERLLNRYNELDDIVSTLGSGMLGITVACARCHDHKYDAFSSKEYYQLLGIFHSGDRVSAKLPSGKDGFFFQDFDDQRRTTWLFRRSDFYDREIEVDLGFPAILSDDIPAQQYWQKAEQQVAANGQRTSTLQRRALADWITDTQHGGGALLARVFVNRMWHHHFGQGLVPTTSDFGVQGDSPSHPELLEYLTDHFVASGWDIKALHRQILLSATWQQASSREAIDLKGLKVDPGNRLLWRRLPQRLEAEVIRDSMLAVSQTLNLQPGGPGFKPYIPPEANLARNIQGESYPKDAKDDAATRRRSVYMFHKRLIPYPMFQAFDRPDLMTSCSRRQNTTVAPQAMVILNDSFVRAVATDFSTWLLEQQSQDLAADSVAWNPIIESAFRVAFSRPPTDQELAVSNQFLQTQLAARSERSQSDAIQLTLTDYCQSLFGLNEFLYVD